MDSRGRGEELSDPGIVSQVLADLVDALPPQQPLTAGAAEVYRRNLADVPPALLQQAAERCIRTCRWFPRVAEIREAAAEIALQLPGEARALDQIDNRVRWARDGQQGEPPPVDPLVVEALARVGGYPAWRGGDGPIVRGQFGRVYREERAAAIRETAARHGIVKPNG